MTMLLDQMFNSRLGYSLRTVPSAYKYVSEAALAERARIRKKQGGVSLVGKKRALETGYFYINAWMLADIAIEIEKASNDKAIAVLFRDCDGTHSSPVGLWASKWESMINGFGRAGFSRGIPMLPLPKSEVWLLCALRSTVDDCSCFEDISGNDCSPNSAKNQLDAELGEHKSGNELCNWLEGNLIDEERLSTMPSFKAFKVCLEQAVTQVTQ
jgi:hypothetical protein